MLARSSFFPFVVVLVRIAAGYGLLSCGGVSAETSQRTQTFEQCTAMVEDRARLACLKALLSRTPAPTEPPSTAQNTESSDNWPLIRTPNPKGGPDALAITRTADTSKSDPDLAGLIVRCQDKPGLEVLLAMVRPLPPKRKREVTLGLGTAKPVLQAEISETGTALILPIDPTALTSQRELTVGLEDPDGSIKGVIPLDGLSPALAKLSATCRSSRP
jgi:hypothetical protein